MKNVLLLASCALLLFSCKNQAQSQKSETNMTTPLAKETIYQFKVEDLSGKSFDFASLKGKKIMIVNTASKCGLTPQYKDLEAVYDGEDKAPEPETKLPPTIQKAIDEALGNGS